VVKPHSPTQSLCVQVGYMKGAGCVACCCIVTQDRVFLCHEDVQTNAVRTLGSLSIALLNAVFTDPQNDTCCVLVSQTICLLVYRIGPGTSAWRWHKYAPGIPAAVRDADTVSSFKRKLKTHFFLCAL